MVWRSAQGDISCTHLLVLSLVGSERLALLLLGLLLGRVELGDLGLALLLLLLLELGVLGHGDGCVDGWGVRGGGECECEINRADQLDILKMGLKEKSQNEINDVE